MSAASKLRSSAFWCLVGALILTNCQTPVAREDSGPTKVLALIAMDDPSGSFADLESTFERNARALTSVQLHSKRIGSIDAFREAILAHAPLDVLVLAFHGRPHKLHLSATESIHQRNVAEVCQGLQGAFRQRGHTILYACLTGEGEDNFGQDLASALRCPVTAPQHFWLMQTALPITERTPEWVRDDSGTITVAVDRFSDFYKDRFTPTKDRYLIAPIAMTSLCEADGYKRLSSRFRLLFKTFRS